MRHQKSTDPQCEQNRDLPTPLAALNRATFSGSKRANINPTGSALSHIGLEGVEGVCVLISLQGHATQLIIGDVLCGRGASINHPSNHHPRRTHTGQLHVCVSVCVCVSVSVQFAKNVGDSFRESHQWQLLRAENHPPRKRVEWAVAATTSIFLSR